MSLFLCKKVLHIYDVKGKSSCRNLEKVLNY